MNVSTNGNRLAGTLLAAALAGACAGGPSPVATHESGPVAIGVAGRTNATPSIASDDPWVALTWSAADQSGATDIFASVSTDRGASFSAPARVNAEPGTAKVNPETPPRIAVRRRGESNADIVVSWLSTVDGTTVRAARSSDGGKTFAASQAVSLPEAPGNRGWHAMSSLDADGRAALVWLDHRDMAASAAVTGADRQADPAVHATPDGAAMAERSQLLFAAFGPEASPIERTVTRGVCYCCKTTIARGPDGSLYAAWRQVYPGNIRDIAFAASRDGGRTFSEPARVSEDRWELNGCPEDGPSMVVGATGIVHIVWPTVVAAEAGEPAKALFYASSADGRSFSPRERIPTLGSPNHPQLAIAPDGTLGLAWDELTDGKRRVAMATRGSAANAFSRRDMPEGPLGRYPVVTEVDGSWVAAWADPSDGGSIVVRTVGR